MRPGEGEGLNADDGGWHSFSHLHTTMSDSNNKTANHALQTNEEDKVIYRSISVAPNRMDVPRAIQQPQVKRSHQQVAAAPALTTQGTCRKATNYNKWKPLKVPPHPFQLERMSHFQLSTSLPRLCTILDNWLSTLGFAVDMKEEKCKWKVSDGSTEFLISIYEDVDPSSWIVEVQRRMGDCVKFQRLYQDLLLLMERNQLVSSKNGSRSNVAIKASNAVEPSNMVSVIEPVGKMLVSPCDDVKLAGIEAVESLLKSSSCHKACAVLVPDLMNIVKSKNSIVLKPALNLISHLTKDSIDCQNALVNTQQYNVFLKYAADTDNQNDIRRHSLSVLDLLSENNAEAMAESLDGELLLAFFSSLEELDDPQLKQMAVVTQKKFQYRGILRR